MKEQMEGGRTKDAESLCENDGVPGALWDCWQVL